MARVARLRAAVRWTLARQPPLARARRSCDAQRRQATVYRQHALHQHHPRHEQPPFPGSREIERRIKSLVRWNALAMVVKREQGSTTASAATSRPSRQPRRSTKSASTTSSRGRASDHDGDVIYFQGHAAPGIYARAFLEGRCRRDEARELPPGAESRRRPVVVSASVADARLLGVPDGLDGPRADLRDLPGAVHALPRGSRDEEALRLEGLGVPRRRRDRRTRIARRHHAGRRARSSTT